VSEVTTPPAAPATAQPAAGARRFSLGQRIILSMIVWGGSTLIRLIGATLRVSVSREERAPAREARPLIASSWHSCIIPSTYICRHLGIRVMSSNSYDGEYMGRIAIKFGFVPVKGSSSRNAVRALLGLRRALQQGWTVSFTLDGPRGPRYKVKPGPVALGRATGAPLAMFHIAVDKAWVLNTWDRLVIPKPFSRAMMRIGKSIAIPPDASDEDLERYQADLQKSLDRVVQFAEANVSKAGSTEFPYYKTPTPPDMA